MASSKVEIVISAVDKASASINAITGATNKMNALSGRGLASIKSGAGNVAVGMGVAAAQVTAFAATAVGAAKAIIAVGSEFERYNIQLAALEGSSEKGAAAMDWIVKFAVKTPLTLDQVTQSYVQLKSFGLDPANGTMQALLDTMAANGKGAEHLGGLTMALGQAWTKGKLQGEEMMQLAERGVPVYDLLSEALGVSTEKIMEMSSKGKIGRKEIQKFIEVMGKKYAGASDEMSKSLDGITANLEDVWQGFIRMINDAGLFDYVKGKAQDLLSTFQQWEKDGTLKGIAQEFSDSLITMLEATWEMGKGLWEVLKAIGSGLNMAQQWVGGWKNLGMILAGLTMAPALFMVAKGIVQIGMGLAMLSTGLLAPVGLVVAAIAGLAAAAYFLVDDWGPVLDWLKGAWESTVTAAIAAGEWISEAFAGAWDSTVAGATAAAGWMKEAFAGVWADVSTGAVDIWTAITPPEGWMTMFATMGSDIMAAVSAVQQFAAVIGGNLMFGLEDWFSSIGGTFDSLGERFNRLGATFVSIGEKIATIFERIFGSVSEGQVNRFMETVGAIAGFTFDSFLKGLDIAVGGIELLFTGIDKLLGLFTGETVLDWSSVIPDIDWASILSFEWADVLPKWDWASIVPDAPDFMKGWFGDEETPVTAEPPAQTKAAVPAAAAAPTKDLQDAAAMAKAISAIDTGAALSALQGVESKASAVVGAVRTAMSSVVSIIAAVDLSTQGARLMSTLAAGINANAHLVTGAIQNVTQKVRDHLPSSPAKTGPLSDIHRLKFMETIAGTMGPGPMVEAMRRAAAATLAAASVSGGAFPVGGGVAGALPGGGAGGAPANVTVYVTVDARGLDPNAMVHAVATKLKAAMHGSLVDTGMPAS